MEAKGEWDGYGETKLAGHLTLTQFDVLLNLMETEVKTDPPVDTGLDLPSKVTCKVVGNSIVGYTAGCPFKLTCAGHSKVMQ